MTIPTRGSGPASLFFCTLLFLTATFFPNGVIWGAERPGFPFPPPPSETIHEDTMLMFVGEALEVLSIASRREESAWQAPAVARVITREEIDVRGIRTLGQALEMAPGFHMARKEWGMQPYLRGIPNSLLFLYDTVPLGSDITKSLNPLGHELSLAPVKRIEIIRGPGSVLWGPDAFAGIVNVVPMTGKDLDGAETGFLYGEPGRRKGAYANVGGTAGLWDGFLSVSGRRENAEDPKIDIVRFWDGEEAGAAAPFEERLGRREPGEERYLEAVARAGYSDWLTLSGRVSDYRRPYGITRAQEDLTWRESRGGTSGFFKLEATKSFNHASAIRFTGSQSWLGNDADSIDRTLEQRERTTYGELIYDRSFLAGAGLFTGGISFREKHVENAPFWSGSLPTFLGPENEFNLLPIVTEADYAARLRSVFGQYSHKLGHVDAWLGLRYDSHDGYGDHLSHSLGMSWSPVDSWIFKLLYGTAYRTPYAQQILTQDDPEPESIDSYTAQISWKAAKGAELYVAGFFSRIEDHVLEDPYAGTEFSLPNHQKIYGVEAAGAISLSKALDLEANLTLFNNSGPKERYHYNDYDFVREDGTVVPHFTDLEYPYDRGAKRLFNLLATWHPFENTTLFGRGRYFSSRDLINPREGTEISLPGVWLFDAGLLRKDLFLEGLDLSISVRNLTDRGWETPGTYAVIDGEGISVEAAVKKAW